MKTNIGTIERVIRGFAGLIILIVAFYYSNWWGLVGLEVLVTGITGWSPVYKLLDLSTKHPAHMHHAHVG